MSDDPIEKATYNTFKKVTLDTTLGKLNRILDSEHFALVVHSQRLCECHSSIYRVLNILSITLKSK
jgi:hypothetical protein